MRSLRMRLMLLTLLAVVPAGIVIYLSARDRQDETEARTRVQALEIARWSALQYQQSIEATRQFLQPVTQTLALTIAARIASPQPATPGGCDNFAAKMIEGDAHIAFLGIALPDGRVICGSAPGATVDDPAFLRQVIQTKAFAVGRLTMASSGTPAVRAGYPLLAGGTSGEAVGVVFADLDLEVFSEVFGAAFAGSALPDGSSVLLVDDGGTVLAGYPDTREWLGQSVLDRPPFARLLSSTSGAVEETTSLSGEESLVASIGLRANAESPRAGIADGFVLVSIPSAATYARLNDQLANDLMVLAGVGGVALAAAWLGSGILLRQLRGYGEVTRRFADGEHDVRMGPHYGAGEIGQIGRAFDDMASTIERQITERELAEQRAHQSEQNYRSLFDTSPQAAIVYDVDTLKILEVNDSAVAQYGYTHEELLAMTVDAIAPEEAGASLEDRRTRARMVIRDGGVVQHRRRDGSTIQVRTSGCGVAFAGASARLLVAEDLTERERLESQLQQSQRMESIGRLAGGVAHDFNNLLSVILNYAEFAQQEITEAVGPHPGEPWTGVVKELHEIETAAHRAAQLTRQLLAFARREAVQPTSVDVNEAIEGIESMLRRTLGEWVHLDVSLGLDIRPTLVDRGQFEQVLVNLAVNARDAMPNGGTITIDTGEIDVDESYAASHIDLKPGAYVRIRVSDTGVGMDHDTIERAFEPFFTTKPKGQGTGLGLATVYGIVNQAGGSVNIYSVVGFGTTFSILLPVHAGAVEIPAPIPAPQRGHGETVLLVEDEDALLQVGRRILERGGYRVVTAANGAEAVARFEDEGQQVDLLLTDMIMPGMMGKTLADRLVAESPSLRVIFMSGYAEPVLGAQGVLDPDISLVEKPFSEQVLLARVAAVLQGRTAPAAR